VLLLNSKNTDLDDEDLVRRCAGPDDELEDLDRDRRFEVFLLFFRSRSLRLFSGDSLPESSSLRKNKVITLNNESLTTK
jgi:hypothetical protein